MPPMEFTRSTYPAHSHKLLLLTGHCKNHTYDHLWENPKVIKGDEYPNYWESYLNLIKITFAPLAQLFNFVC